MSRVEFDTSEVMTPQEAQARVDHYQSMVNAYSQMKDDTTQAQGLRDFAIMQLPYYQAKLEAFKSRLQELANSKLEESAN